MCNRALPSLLVELKDQTLGLKDRVDRNNSILLNEKNAEICMCLTLFCWQH